MLDIDHGTYPFVTSSSATAGGACTGTGVAADADQRRHRRVESLHHARRQRTVSHPRSTAPSANRFASAAMNSASVTGRPRRCGWFDVPLLRYTAMVNGFDSLIVTKLDVLDELDEIPVCVAYKLDGKTVEEMPARNADVERLQPVLETIKGWKQPTRGISRYEELPPAARSYIEFLGKQTGVEIGCVSTGPERTETMVLKGSKLEQLLGS